MQTEYHYSVYLNYAHIFNFIYLIQFYSSKKETKNQLTDHNYSHKTIQPSDKVIHNTTVVGIRTINMVFPRDVFFSTKSN